MYKNAYCNDGIAACSPESPLASPIPTTTSGYNAFESDSTITFAVAFAPNSVKISYHTTFRDSKPVQTEVAKQFDSSKWNGKADNVSAYKPRKAASRLWRNVRLLGAYSSISPFSSNHHVCRPFHIHLAIQLRFRLQCCIRNIQTKDKERPGLPSAPSHPPIVRLPRGCPYRPSGTNPWIQRVPER